MVFSYFKKRKLKKQQIEELREALVEAVRDGEINDAELAQIRRFSYDSELSQEEYQRLIDEIYTNVVDFVVADRRLDAAERAAVTRIADRLQVSAVTRSALNDSLNYFEYLQEIQNCHKMKIPHRGGVSGVPLTAGERDYFAHPAQLLEERVVSRQSVGRSSGVSIRIMKGVSYRVGQSRGVSVPVHATVPVSSGDFVITNKRLIFAGDRKSVNAPYDKLLHLEPFSDGLRFSVTNRQKPVTIQFFTDKSAEIAAVLISRMLND
jgi:hypothetical protein